MFNERQTIKYSPAGEALTDLILATFRLNGCLLNAGDRLTKGYGLTSALWQVLGAIDKGPLPVAQIARNMGLTRQSVQRSANLLEKKGFIEFCENPDHKRANLVRLTENGGRVLDEVMRMHIEWSNHLAEGIEVKNLKNVIQTMHTVIERLKER